LARSDVIIIIAEAMFHRRFLQVLMMERGCDNPDWC